MKIYVHPNTFHPFTMTLVHRALFTWFVTLNFVIFLSLRLELRTQWNFFIVFIPLWVFDAILLVYVIIRIITKWRNLARLKELLIGYQWYIAAVLLKIAGQTMICLKLEYPHLDIPIYVTMIPIWALLSSTVTYVFIKLIHTKLYYMKWNDKINQFGNVNLSITVKQTGIYSTGTEST